jgi:hypothetical protein
MFEVKKSVIFSLCKTSSANFESFWLKSFVLHKVEALYIVLGNWIANPQKNKSSKKSLFSFIKGSSNRKRYV